MPTAAARSRDANEATDIAHRLVDHVATVLEGKRAVIELAVVTLLARGHLLIEDVPGVGKTTLARALAASLGVSFRRVQFTSDLMPADVLGGNVYEPSTGKFSFRPGPIFTNVLLADEINRTTPKTQSALLEAMDEGRASIDGHTHALGDPFFVVATQNPQDFYGTYPLPESQLDRFLVRTHIGYPPPEVERSVIDRRRGRDPIDGLSPVISRDELATAQRALDHVRVEAAVIEYLHDVVLRTRRSPLLALGVSTRAALGLERTIRARAVVEGRAYALPDDVKQLAVPVFAHRVRVGESAHGQHSRADAEAIIQEIVDSLPVPV